MTTSTTTDTTDTLDTGAPAPGRTSVQDLYDFEGEHQEDTRQLMLMGTGLAAILLGIAVGICVAPLPGVLIAGVLGGLLLGSGGRDWNKRSRARSRRRIAAELESYYGVSEVDVARVPIGVGVRRTMTVRRDGEYLTVTATLPSSTSPVVLLVGDRELPAA